VKTKHLFFWSIVCEVKGIDTALLKVVTTTTKKTIKQFFSVPPSYPLSNLLFYDQVKQAGSERPPGFTSILGTIVAKV
jgi:hypothetical protein